jgi:hypothetical protein
VLQTATGVLGAAPSRKKAQKVFFDIAPRRQSLRVLVF